MYHNRYSFQVTSYEPEGKCDFAHGGQLPWGIRPLLSQRLREDAVLITEYQQCIAKWGFQMLPVNETILFENCF